MAQAIKILDISFVATQQFRYFWQVITDGLHFTGILYILSLFNILVEKHNIMVHRKNGSKDILAASLATTFDLLFCFYILYQVFRLKIIKHAFEKDFQSMWIMYSFYSFPSIRRCSILLDACQNSFALSQ